MKSFLLVGIGGALGAMARYGITVLFTVLGWSSLLATMTANLAGSFLMGLLVSMALQQPLLLLATVGFCGGFTTFSTFSMQSITLFQQGQYTTLILYILLTLIFCLLAAFAGCLIGRQIGL